MKLITYLNDLNDRYCHENAYKYQLGNKSIATYGIIVLDNENVTIKNGSIIMSIERFKKSNSISSTDIELRMQVKTKDMYIENKEYCVVDEDFQCKNKADAVKIIAGGNARQSKLIKLNQNNPIKYINNSGKIIYATDGRTVLIIDENSHIIIDMCENSDNNGKEVDSFDELALKYRIIIDLNEWTGSFEDDGTMKDFSLSEYIIEENFYEVINTDIYDIEEPENDDEDIKELNDILGEEPEDMIEPANTQLNDIEETKENQINDNTLTTNTEWDANNRTAQSQTMLSQNIFNSLSDTIQNALNNSVIKVQPLETKKNIEKETENKNNEQQESIAYTQEDFNNSIKLKDGLTLKDLLTLIQIKHALLFTAPPGTGKTTAAIELANVIAGETNSSRVKLLSFNQYTEYSDLVCGLQQNKDGHWIYVNGRLKDLCEIAISDKDNKYVFIIDEINRGNPEAVLGEYLTAMSKIGVPVRTNNGDTVCMPENLYIIATMNTIDSSVSKLDAAFRDRFAIVDMQAESFSADDIKPNASQELKVTLNKVIDKIIKINKYLKRDPYKGSENALGMRQLYTDYKDINELKLVIEYCIKPQIEVAKTNIEQSDKDKVDKLLDELMDNLEE
jgi:MoxR-like ATPase